MEEAFKWARDRWENRPDFLKWNKGTPMLQMDPITVTASYGTNRSPLVPRPKVFGDMRDILDQYAQNARGNLGLGKPVLNRTSHQMHAYRDMVKKIGNPASYENSSPNLTFKLNKTKIKPLNQSSMLSQAYGGAGSYKV